MSDLELRLNLFTFRVAIAFAGKFCDCDRILDDKLTRPRHKRVLSKKKLVEEKTDKVIFSTFPT